MAEGGGEANSTVDRGDELVIFDGDAHGTPMLLVKKRALSQSTARHACNELQSASHKIRGSE
jgi:hypothetical protein